MRNYNDFSKEKWKREKRFGKIEWFVYDKDNKILGSIETDLEYEAVFFAAKQTFKNVSFIDRVRHNQKTNPDQNVKP